MHPRLVVLLVLATAAALVPPPAHGAGAGDVAAHTVTVSERHEALFPGLDRRMLSLRLDDRLPAVANVLQFRQDDPMFELRPVLARGGVVGLETTPEMGRRVLQQRGIAGINGGFWLASPLGDPNGYLAADGLLVSEAQTQGGGPRGAAAMLPDGRLLLDRLAASQDLAVGSATPVRLNGVNRYPSSAPPFPDGDHTSFVYTDRFGSAVAVRARTSGDATLPVRAFVVAGLQPRASGTAVGTVQSVRTIAADVPVPAGGAVVVSHGDHATRFAGAGPGAQVTVRVGLQPSVTDPAEWAGIAHGLAAGPLIVQDGERTDPSTWETEGFAAGTHSNVRHPRSAIGRAADGRVFLVTVDGRQPGYSSGMTMHELAHFMRQLGAVDALSLDGGGSTQLATDGQLRNRPCCDASLRPVATGLFVHHRYEFAAAERLAGPSRAATAAAIAVASHPSGAGEVLLATQTTFADALAGGPLAVRRDAPLLLTSRGSLPAATEQALERLRPQRVTLLGGTAAISGELAASLSRRYQVRRVSGTSREATAAAVARELGARHTRAFLVVGDPFADALSASAPAGMLGMPILLSRRDTLPTSTRDVLVGSGVREVFVAGGTGAVSERVAGILRNQLGIAVTRLSGTSRYGTARALNTWAEGQITSLDQSGLVVALGERFPDALAGGPLAARRNQLLMIVPGRDVRRDPQAAAYLDARAPALGRVTLLGGHGALTSYQHWQLDQLAR